MVLAQALGFLAKLRRLLTELVDRDVRGRQELLGVLQRLHGLGEQLSPSQARHGPRAQSISRENKAKGNETERETG